MSSKESGLNTLISKARSDGIESLQGEKMPELLKVILDYYITNAANPEALRNNQDCIKAALCICQGQSKDHFASL